MKKRMGTETTLPNWHSLCWWT